MNDLTISNAIKYIGVDDADIDLFESQYVVPHGISYNSYLILDEKIAILDTVDKRKAREWWQNLNEALSGKSPDYLIVQHLEPDHAGLVGEVMNKYPQLKLVATQKAINMLPLYFEQEGLSERCMPVSEGDVLSLGAHRLQFFHAPMVHWPEVMVTYEQTEGVLFSADGFGKFGVLSHDEAWACEARRYYFNICGKYGAAVQSLLKKASALDVKMICPLHGPILRTDLGYYLGLYDTWSSYRPETDGVFIAYASIHGHTAAAAHCLADILRSKNAKVAIADLTRDDMAEAVEDAFKHSRMVVCAASYDGSVFPPMHDFLHHLKLKLYQKRRVAIVENGSWAPCAARVMHDMLSQMKDLDFVAEHVTIRGAMKAHDVLALEALADEILA
jgi:flavorubredoxin